MRPELPAALDWLAEIRGRPEARVLDVRWGTGRRRTRSEWGNRLDLPIER